MLTGGPSGKGPDFGKINAASGKLNGIIQSEKVATVEFVIPTFVTPKGEVIGEAPHESPAATHFEGNGSATIYVTSGAFGILPGDMFSNGKAAEPTLSDILFHEMGHVGSKWFNGNPEGSRGQLRDAVQMENDERNINHEPTRLYHSKRGDTDPD